MHGRASNYTFTERSDQHQSAHRFLGLYREQCEIPAATADGLAWSPFGNQNKTVVRAGFGMYNDLQDALGYRTDQNAPFNPTYSLPSLQGFQLPLSPFATVPSGREAGAGRSAAGSADSDSDLLVVPRSQQELTANTALTVGYVGSHGYHEIIGVDANEPFPVICPAAPCPATYPSQFPGRHRRHAGGRRAPTMSLPPTRANPALNNTWTYFLRGRQLLQRAAGGPEPPLQQRLGAARSLYLVEDHRRRGFAERHYLRKSARAGSRIRSTRARTGDWRTLMFATRPLSAQSYALPFGRGKRFLNNASGFGKRLAGGWTINSIVTLQGGFPFSPQLSYNPSNNGDTRNPVRPFVNPAFTGPVILGNPNQWFNPAAFLAPPNSSGFYGNLGRNTLIGPGLATVGLVADEGHPDQRAA